MLSALFSAMASSHTNVKHRNRLADSKSPYLLQHAHNPVYWYPWSTEAFELAKKENKPIFLSVGYSTCHWCHVMERESFVNEDVAKLMNENFVNIKVDREERPDVDKLYMTFVTAITGSGGWPMSVFLTPNGAPLTGGTYFPPRDMGGSIGFTSILKLVADQWKTNYGSVVSQGQALSNALRHELATKTGEIPNADTVINATFDHLVDGFDSQYGGFGVTTKFPKPVDLNFLLFASKYLKSNFPDKSAKAINIVRKTLSAMVRGGIHDHLGGGFHRYAVDRQWRVPHFEKMLYDQGQLLTVFADFYKITGEFADAIPDIVGYLDSNLTHKTGGFYAAEDAESYPFEGANKKEEGAYFVFMTEELMSCLTPEQYRAFEAYFNISADGNTPSSADPQGELRCKNVLFTLDKPIAELAQRVGQDVSEFEENLKAAKAIVLEKRGHRPAPGLDTKFITSWNSLAISGLCSAYAAFPKEKAYLERAQKAVEFIKENLIDSDGKLLRTVYTDGKNGKIVQIPEPVFAFSDDYTFLIQALLDLYQADFNEDHLKLALKLQNQLDTDFFDPEHKAGYFTNRAGDNTLFARFSEDQDGAEPAPNSVAVDNFLRFADLLGDETFREQANWILKGHAHRLSKHPHAITKMVAAAGRAATSSMQIVIVAPTRDDSVAGQMLDLVHKKFLPDASLAFVSEDVKDSLILTKNEHTRELAKATPGATTAYVCQNFACGLPATDVFELEARLLD